MGNGNGLLHGRGSVDPGGGDIHPAQLMNSTTALAARSHGGKGALSSAAQIKLGEPQPGKVNVRRFVYNVCLSIYM